MKILWTIFFFMTAMAQANVVSPSSVELKVKFTAKFFTSDLEEDVDTLIENHYQHMFGYFHSPKMVKSYGIYKFTGGMAAPKLPMNATLKKETVEAGVRHIEYNATGLILMNKKAAAQVLAVLEEGIPRAIMKITLPSDLDNYYDKKCTDEHYDSIGDFWYFYDPYRKGCSHLRNSPLAQQVDLVIAPEALSQKNYKAKLNLLRGDNGNGDLFEIVTINGFSESANDQEDDGRVTFEEMNESLEKQGFTKTMVQSFENRPVVRFEKELTDKNGKKIKVKILRLLAETSVTAKNKTFAKFFKAAIEQADVIVYSGHSGLGGNLDIPSLEEKAGEYVFNNNKRQIFFFDGCSSYSYYLAPFEARKKKSKVDIITNGLSSYFSTQNIVIEEFFKYLFDLDNDPTWMEILTSMESVLEEDTYMLNVGAL